MARDTTGETSAEYTQHTVGTVPGRTPDSSIHAPAKPMPTARRVLGYSSWEEVTQMAQALHNEAQALLLFREAVAAEYAIDPNTAARFMRARKHQLDKSVKMFRSAQEWRRDEQVDLVLSESEAAAEVAINAAFRPVLLDAKDKRGRPIVFCSMGEIDLPGLAKKGVTLQMLVRRAIRESERMRIAVENADGPLAGHLLIQDIGTCTVGKFLRSMRFFAAQAKISQDYYPELLGQLVILRGPAATAWAVGQVKRFIDKDTADKIHIGCSDSRKALADFVSEEVAEQVISMLPPKGKESRETAPAA